MSGVIVTNLVKSFGVGDARVTVLNGTDFSAEAGKMTFLVGPSGCGKTTLISVIAAMLSVDSGAVDVFGTNPLILKPREVVRFRGETVGFVFQQFNLLPSLDAAENAAVPLIVQQGMRSARLARAWCKRIQASIATLWRPAAARGDRPRAGPRTQAHRLR